MNWQWDSMYTTDTALLTKFNNNKLAAREYIYRTVASVSSTYSHSNMRLVANFKLLLMNITHYNESINRVIKETRFPLGVDYKEQFCSQMKKLLSSEQLDHLSTLVLVTGHNFILKETDENTGVQGLAPIGGLCHIDDNGSGCTIVEGRSFKAALVMAHEMAHLFGIMHDPNDDKHWSTEVRNGPEYGRAKEHMERLLHHRFPLKFDGKTSEFQIS